MASSNPISRGYRAAGRLADPASEVYQDPRIIPDLLSAMSRSGVARNRAPPSLARLDVNSTMQDLARCMAEAEAGFEKLFDDLPNKLPEDEFELEVERIVENVKGPDDTTLRLHVFRPTLRGGPLPCVVTVQGIGMTIMKVSNKVFARWCTSLAAQGMIVVAVEFRNAWSEEGIHPFPAGLNDVCAAIRWVHSRKTQLNARNLIIQGYSGGGNLVLAAALKARRQGWVSQIDGVMAFSPTISGAYGWSGNRKLAELPSLVECHGYFLNLELQALMAHFYSPQREDEVNPLAWPYFAVPNDLQGLPPHMLYMDELDPCRDEGIAYSRKLSAAGVRCAGRINLGHTHAAGLIFRQAIPWSHISAVRDVTAFARAV